VEQLAADLTDEELGRQLWLLAAAARTRGLDPEGALRRQTDRVIADVESDAE
jgi:XTP/dITP diphosphohydrolase/tetrapyrrole methylase family protein/MazG family protein